MADVVDAATRSRMMSGIRSKDTGIEVIVRRALFRKGFRFRLHVKHLPGKPDIVFPKYRAVIFVHGCFWHRHGCRLFKLPSTRTDFWMRKLEYNRLKDTIAVEELLSSGWRVGVVWQCQLQARKLASCVVMEALAEWLKGTDSKFELGL